MISKPDHKMRRGFWHADAWAAARAERPARWHTPYPENPLFSRVLVGFLMFASLMNGVRAGALCFAFFFCLAEGGNLLRRVLMYWSIRRYGGWHEMAPEMLRVLNNPSDLAERPARFARMPRGFTSTASAPPPVRETNWLEDLAPVIFMLFCILVLLTMP